MRADDLDWSEGFRPLGRQAIAEIIAQCAAHAALQSGRGGAGLCRVARKSTCATPVLLVATHCRAVRLIRGERPMTTNNPITLTASEPATGPWVECDTPAKLRLSGNGPAYCKLGRQVGYRREVLDRFLIKRRQNRSRRAARDEFIATCNGQWRRFSRWAGNLCESPPHATGSSSAESIS